MRREDGRSVAKADLPTKTCFACGKPMVWRKTWARNWEAVKYCSDRCRAAGCDLSRSPPPGRS